MKVKFVSNEYMFKDGTHHLMVARMSYVEGEAMVEFSLNNRRIYYYILPEETIENMSDLDIINEAVDHMKEDKERWIGDCEQFISNSNNFILHERATLYRLTVNDNEQKKHKVVISVVEENDNKFTLRFKDEGLNSVMTITIAAENRKHLIDSLEKIAKIMIGTLAVFRAEQEQIVLNTFGKDYALKQGMEKVESNR